MKNTLLRIYYWIKDAFKPLDYVLVAGFLITIIFVVKRCNKEKGATTRIENLQEIRKDSTSYWRDKFNQEHAQKQLAEGNLAEIKVVYGDMIKKKAQELDVKEKQIKSLTAFSTTQKVKLKDLVDKYSKYDTSYKSGQDGNPDTVFVVQVIDPEATAEIEDSLSVAQYYKKEGFLKLRRQNYVDVVSHNPNTRVNNLHGIRITDYDPAVKVRPVAAALWYPDGSFGASAGIGIELKVLKIPLNISFQRVLIGR